MKLMAAFSIKLHKNNCKMSVFGHYRGGLAPAVEGDLMPRGDEGPGRREVGDVLEMPADVMRRPLQYLRQGGFPVVDVSTDSVVHIRPEGGDEGPAVAQGERLWRELAHMLAEGYHAIVVDLGRQFACHLF